MLARARHAKLRSFARRWMLGPAVAALLIGCRAPRASAGSGEPGYGLGDAVDPELVEPAHRAAWAKMVEAHRRDPGAEAVVEAADELLAAAPPPALELAARLAKAEVAQRRGDDRGAVSLLEGSAVAAPGGSIPPELELRRRRQLAFALARGGVPERALEALSELDARGEIETLELRAARAAALDRTGRGGDALGAYVAWRELLPDTDPAAEYAELRVGALARGRSPAELRRLAGDAPGPDARDCLRRYAGDSPDPGGAAWVRRCGAAPETIGVLLPRTGPLAALADEHLAAAASAVELLGSRRTVEVRWEDAGRGGAEALAAAERLAATGVERIVGPMAPDAVARVGAVRVPFVVPGEAGGGGEGVAPALEARVEALVDAARRAGHAGLVVLHPANGYGERGARAARSACEKLGVKALKIQSYSAGQTSFSSELETLRAGPEGGAALLVIDALPRVELMARQLRRWSEGRGPQVLTTGEGYGPRTVGRGHEALDGVWIAPVAALDGGDPADAAFARHFEARQGDWPSDQAVLVWRAFERAWRGGHEAPRPLVRTIRGGQLVALPEG